MRLGTTPTHVFEIPVSADQIEDVRIVYAQAGVEVLAKEIDDCELKGNTITVKLTQEETFLFDQKLDADVQVRILTVAGEVLASDIMKMKCDPFLGEEVAL